MITGQQIKEARILLGLSVVNMAERFDVKRSTITRAEASDGEPAITFAQAARMQNMFEKRGIVFSSDGLGVSRQNCLSD